MSAPDKVCKGCGVEKPRTSFNRESRTRDGLRARCQECTRAQSAAWRAANQPRVKAYSKADAQRRKDYQREWRAANPERIRSYRRRTGEIDYLTQWRKRDVSADTTAQVGTLRT